MEKLSYKLDAFQGPLDLLLYLIGKNKLDILDISISELLEQYMDQINAMNEGDMDVASEFLEMAARLIYIKTVSLLPKHEEEEELKRELTGQLLEYQECRRIAAWMTESFQLDSCFVRVAVQLESDKAYKRHHTPQQVLLAYQHAIGRGNRIKPPSAQAFSGIVTRRIVSVASKILYLLQYLWKKQEICYDDLFEENQEKSEMVAMFLAVLELVKDKRIWIEGYDGSAKMKLINGGVENWKLKELEEQ